MKFARLKLKYKYNMKRLLPEDEIWDGKGNTGDAIQNLAIENIYKEMGIKGETLDCVNRDDITSYQGDKVILPMQGWFGNIFGCCHFPLSEKIIPVFIGYHLNPVNNTREKFVLQNISQQMKAFQPIGCRDRNTRDFFASQGLDSYFSGCMTLTFPTRTQEPQNGKTFLVDLSAEAKKIIPEDIKKIADTSVIQTYHFDEYPVTEEGALAFENEARRVLKIYREEASLVITSKIHCAMPCVAMGIPVIFIHEHPNNERLDVLKGIIPIYSPRRPKNINWTPKKVDIEHIKKAIKNNAMFQIWKTAQKHGLPTEISFNPDDENKFRNELIEVFHDKQKPCSLFGRNLQLYRYALMSKITWGKKRGRYQKKYQSLKIFLNA